ncbi:response regulator transcription factor [soil metagenome]
MKCIICDDHPIVVLSTAMLIEAGGHEVAATTPRPDELLELVLRHRPDVCIVDLLHGGSADAALEAIRDVACLADVVVLSGAVDGSMRIAAEAAGARTVVSKAATGRHLLASIEGLTAAEEQAADRVRPPPRPLTARQRQVLQYLAAGVSSARIAELLGIQHSTARSHIRGLLVTLGVRSRAAAVAHGVREGLADAS